MATHSSTLAWKIPWTRSLVGCSPWSREESDRTERLHFHFSLSRTGEGNGNPLQCSCQENPRDGGAWWAAMGSHRVGHDWSDLAKAAIQNTSSITILTPNLPLTLSFLSMGKQSLLLFYKPPHSLLLSTWKNCGSLTYLSFKKLSTMPYIRKKKHGYIQFFESPNN